MAPALYSFPAGRMDRVGSSNRVRADPRKGTVTMRLAEEEDETPEEDQIPIIYLTWSQRAGASDQAGLGGTGLGGEESPEVDDYLIMPAEAVFEPVETGSSRQPERGQVYVLRWKETSKRVFFWMQDKDGEKVARHVRRFNELLQDPRSQPPRTGTQAFPGPQAIASNTVQENALGSDDELQSGIDLLRPMQNSQPGVNGTAPNEGNADLLRRMLDPSANAAGSAVPNSGPLQMSTSNQNRLTGSGASLMSEETQGRGASTLPGIGTEALPSARQGYGPGPLRASDTVTGSDGGGGATTESQLAEMNRILSTMTAPALQPQQEAGPPISLADILSPSRLSSLLSDSQTRAALFPHLPAVSQEGISGGQVDEQSELRNIVSSAPFQQSIRTLQYALETGQLGPMMQSLGLPEDAGLSVEHFLRAIQERTSRSADPSRDDEMDTT